MGEEALKIGNQVEVFLLSDGVWIGKQRDTATEKKLSDLIRDGCKVNASRKHLKACGLNQEKLLDGINITNEPYDKLVDLVMERWDKVVIF